MAGRTPNDPDIDLLKFNYKNLHESVWECHKASWLVTSIFIPIIFAMQGYFIRDYFSALNMSATGMSTFHVLMGAVVILSLAFVWWLIMRIFSKYNKSRMNRLKEIENIIHINNTDPVQQYKLHYTLHFMLNLNGIVDWIKRRKCLFSWNDVPGNDSDRLRRCLKDDYDIDGVNVEICKSADDKTIFIYMADKISAETRINEKGRGEKSVEIRKSADDKTIVISMVDKISAETRINEKGGWEKSVEIHRSADDKTIFIYMTDKISAETMIDEKGEKATLKSNDGRTQTIYIEKNNGKLKMYKRLDKNYQRIKITFDRVCDLILVVTVMINISLLLYSIYRNVIYL
jgi:hypothetical protein